MPSPSRTVAMPEGGPVVRLSPRVSVALERGDPVVVLESSVLAQGLAPPANRQAWVRMANAVCSAGATEAVAAVVCGVPTLGIEGEDLERFLTRRDIRKLSARDLPWAIVAGADGAATVAGTLAIARSTSVEVFATGGIGGVHRRRSTDEPPDESADLLELARSPMVVVCAGAKAVLDVPATWERLETLGIPVIGYRTSVFPGFYSADSGIPLPWRAETAAEIARAYRALRRIGASQALVVVNPPPPGHALGRDEVEATIALALDQARVRGVRGGAVTPFLLDAVNRLTGGRSQEANLALLEGNAALAAQIARELSAERGTTRGNFSA